MSDQLKLAFEEVSKRPAVEQDAFAAFILAELDDENRWQEQFAESTTALAKLAAKAGSEHAAGKTKPPSC